MIRRLLAAVVVCGMCCGVAADAADIPFSTLDKPVRKLKVVAKPKKSMPVVKQVKPRKATEAPVVVPKKQKPVVAADLPAAADDQPADEKAVASQDLPAVDSGNELDMAWVLDPLVAHADGPKREGSASITGNLIVVEPGFVTSPYMVIELNGHIVKTPQTVVRIDVQIGKTTRSVTWKSDDVQSGRFNVELTAPMQAGKLPGYFPVSAIAFVTREGKNGVAMVSLEKIRVRVGKVKQVAAQ